MQEEDPEKIFVAKLLTYPKVNRKYEYSLIKAGVICLSFDADWLDQWLDPSEFAQDMQIFVVNDENQILYKNGDLNANAALEMLKQLGSTDGQSEYQEYRNVHYLTQKNEIGAGLCMLSIAPLEELKAMTGQMLTIILVVMVCVLLIGTVLILIFSCYFLQPTELVSVQEEIRLIQHYEWIQQISCAVSIQFTYHIMPECEQYQIPKLMIQPLVENSIAYGTNDEDDTVWVDICVKEAAKGVLKILITDSGTDAQIDQMNRYIRGECEMDTEHQSLGVRNVYERVKLFFGENGDLSYYRNENGNTVAVITISTAENSRS